MMKTSEKRHLFDAFIYSQETIGLYIHLPFCKARCNYCDFLSGLSYKIEDQYIDALVKELDLYYKSYGKLNIDSIYLGGGTPSSLKASSIERLVKKIYSLNHINEDLEFTIEVNPESVDKNKVRTYKELGINRISMGCQSFIDDELEVLGRIHSSKDIYRAYDDIRSLGFSNINLDLISAIPHQSMDSLDYSLDELISLNPSHLSCYSLILEEGTKLYDLVKGGRLGLVSDIEDRKFYHHIIDRLEKEGYQQYEISNFAKKGCRSKHNLKYWNCNYYIGMGLGASSFFDESRYKNTDSVKEYMDKINREEFPWTDLEKMDFDKLKTDYILMRMRLVDGIDRKKYKNIFSRDFYMEYKDLIDSFVSSGHMLVDPESVRFTRLGFDISNQFFVEII